jgi:transcription-repair coupling factor (superfamily II helicase)
VIYPYAVRIRDGGPRDGIQSERAEVSIENKVRLIDALSETGLRYIEAVGFEMYTRLLEEAAKELRGQKVERPPDVRIDLPVDAYLPTSYIDREPLRLAAYRRVAETVTGEDVADARAELADRYGPLPAPARSLLELADLRAELRAAGVTDVSLSPHELYGRVARLRGVTLDEPQLNGLRAGFPGTMSVEATQTLLVPLPDEGEVDLILWLHDVVQSVQGVGDGGSGGVARAQEAVPRSR